MGKTALETERDFIDADHITECFESINTVINFYIKVIFRIPILAAMFIRLSDDAKEERITEILAC